MSKKHEQVMFRLSIAVYLNTECSLANRIHCVDRGLVKAIRSTLHNLLGYEEIKKSSQMTMCI